MATKLIASLMLALLVLPSCCCLKQGESKGSKKEDCGSKCCAELGASSMPVPTVPLGSEEDPCDCKQIASQVLGLPEDGVTIATNLELDFATEWVEIEVPAFFQTDSEPKSLVNLSSVQPPGRRFCQEYCVYLI